MSTEMKITVAAIALFLSGAVLASDCVLHVTRTACPGKEQESFSKCSGKASCDENKPAATLAQCVAKAKDACKNSRLTVTKNKKVTGEFDGTPLQEGKDFCVGHPDYPFAAKPDCK